MTDEFKTPLEDIGLPDPLGRALLRGPRAVLPRRPPVDLPVEVASVRTVGIPGKLRYHPTVCVLPEWADRRIMTEGVRRFKFEPPKVERITEVFDIAKIKLEASPIFPRFGKVLDSGDVIDRVAEEVPVDGEEIVSWMHEATAANIVASAREVEFNKHSLYVSRTGDPYIPGVRLSGFGFYSARGYDVARRGYGTVFSPGGRINIPVNGARNIITRDFLGWCNVGPPRYGIQWTGLVSQIQRLANRITEPLGFLSLFGRVAPTYVTQEPPSATERATTNITLNSDRAQTVHFTFRNPENYTEIVDEGDVAIPRGQSRLSYVVASYPAVPPLVVQQQPVNGSRTVLERFEVS